MELTEGIYKLANSTTTCPSFSTSLTRALFLNLGQESLLFLARAWSVDDTSDIGCQNIRVAALCHARAFVLAHSDDPENVKDFQMILPSLVTCLQSKLPLVRGAAVECIGSISVINDLAKNSPPIYGFGFFPGECGALLSVTGANGSQPETTQVLDWPDVVAYSRALKDRREFFVSDPSYAAEFHSDLLKSQGGSNSIAR